MKNKLLFLVASSFLLASCGNNSPVRPRSDDDSSNTSISVFDPSSIVSSLSAGIGTYDLENVIETAQLSVMSIKSYSSKRGMINYSYPNGYSNKAETESSTLTVDSYLYDNSVKFTNYSAPKSKDYVAFGCANEDGNFVADYVYIDAKFENIETILVTQKEKETTTTPKIVGSVLYTLDAYDKYFSYVEESMLISGLPDISKIELAGYLSSGDVYARYIDVVSLGKDQASGFEGYMSTRYEYFFTNNNLLKRNQFATYYLVDDQSLQIPLIYYSTSYEFSESSNGSFDKSKLPEIKKLP